ncbi:MAG: hypothetical protein DRQ58_09615 [Gammaproteobacteria bacterium]|nr:MAG: hypothetical protein DRQ58_09615 [Gammaproteobacteria bacterium]
MDMDMDGNWLHRNDGSGSLNENSNYNAAKTTVAYAAALIPDIEATYSHGVDLASSAAETFCDTLAYGVPTVDNWRLPTDTELQTLVEVGGSLQSFTNFPYWSSATASTATHISVQFDAGTTADTADTDALHVRCVHE